MTPNTQSKNKSDEKNKNAGQGSQSNAGSQSGQASHGSSSQCETGTSTMDRAKETISSMSDRAKDAASAVQERAGHAASYVGQKAEDATSAVGGSLKSLSQTIREKTPSTGMMGNASSAVADSLERTGRYLEEEGLSGMADDITDLIRRNPIPSLLVGVGIGFLLARAMTSRRS